VYLVVPPGGCFPDSRRIELGPETLTIGRAEACDIRVDVPGVDEEHAKISEVALVAMGADCAIGDVPLDSGQRRLVMPGDEIQIGSIVLVLEGHDPSIAPPPPDGRAPTLPAPRVRVVEGKNFGDELLLAEENREYVIGRGPKSDLSLDDREVSREHVKLLRRGYAVYLQDQSSTRGSWLGRSAVYTGSTVEWSRPRMLRVGATVLALELPEAIRRAAPAAQASAPMTPPPRSRGGVASSPGSLGGTPAPSSASGAIPSDAISTQRLPSYRDPAPVPTPSTPRMGPPRGAPGAGAGPAVAGGDLLIAPGGPIPAQGLGRMPPVSHARKAWKGGGPTIGKASGLLLLALAGLAILGALFVVFSLLE